MAVVLKGFFKVPPEELENIIKHLQEHIKNTLMESGCIDFSVKQDKEDKFKFNVFETFINNEAFEAHQERVKNSTWGKITKNLERVYEIKND